MIGAFKVPGTCRFRVGFDLVVAWSMEMPTDDLSGNTSLTDKADKGIKSKRLAVAFSIRETRSELDYWSRLLTTLEAKDGQGQAMHYVVVHPLAQASRIRTMRLVGQVRVAENPQFRQYDVSFELEEVRSVPEAAEARQSRSNGAAPTSTLEAALSKLEAQAKA